MNPQRLHSIMRTSRIKSAAPRKKRRNSFLVDFYEKYQDPRGDTAGTSGFSVVRTPAGASNDSSSCITVVRVAFFIRCLGIRTIRQGRMRSPSSRKLSHNRRRALFRSTANRLYFLLQMTPHRANLPSPGATETAMREPARRYGALFRRSNSDLRCNLEFLRKRSIRGAKSHSLEKYSGGSRSGGQSLAALLATAFDDHASGVGGHAGKETDPAFATPIGGLKSSFHL